MTRAFGIIILAVVVSSGTTAAHHSNAMYFTTNAVTLEGEVVRVEWINPHVLVYLQAKNDKGESETWILHGSSLNNGLRQMGAMKERLVPGVSITARVWLPRNPLYVNDAQTVLLTRHDDARESDRIVGAGQIRFSNGDLMTLGGGPTF